ncbi:hypothetical protein BRADI_1g58849v3 [Brachypodium distachyon]|uniref:Uncharacterized protein n=1 Tax=Brachypodium distachyon TaxID=15368 RepID=A0A0Q3S7S2_BRADI|nr:hypothetical protein BRADI_1g58849v3 [Brachypodium distachyon]
MEKLVNQLQQLLDLPLMEIALAHTVFTAKFPSPPILQKKNSRLSPPRPRLPPSPPLAPSARVGASTAAPAPPSLRPRSGEELLAALPISPGSATSASHGPGSAAGALLVAPLSMAPYLFGCCTRWTTLRLVVSLNLK